MNFLLHLRQEWDVISKTPFACVICVVIGFAVGSWYYAEQVATLDRQVQFWKDRATATGTATATATVTTAPAPGPRGASTAPENSAHFTLTAREANFYVSPSDHSMTGIVLDADIRNSGTTSLATGWKLTVTPKGKDPVTAEYMDLPKVPFEVPGNRPFTLKPSDSLADKAAKVERKLIRGRLLFYVRLPMNVVADDATVFTLSVQDVAGNVFTAERRGG